MKAQRETRDRQQLKHDKTLKGAEETAQLVKCEGTCSTLRTYRKTARHGTVHACSPSTVEMKDRPIPGALTNQCPVSERRCLLVHIYTNVHKEEEEKTPTTQSSSEFCSFPAPKLVSQCVTSCKDRRGSRGKGGGGKGRGSGEDGGKKDRGLGSRSIKSYHSGWGGTV